MRSPRILVALLVALGAAAPSRAGSSTSPPERRTPPEMRVVTPVGRPAVAVRDTGRVPAPIDLDLPIAIDRGWFLIRAAPGMEREAEAAARRLPDSFARIAADLPGLPVPSHIELRLVHRTEDLARAAPPGRGAPAWAVGVAWPDTGVMAVALRRRHEVIDLGSTIDHELAHLALGAALGGRAPRWLDEGFAYIHSSDWSLARSQTLTAMAWTGNVIPLGELDGHFRGAEDEASRAYAQAYDMVSFLARRGRHADREDDGDRWPFRDLLAAIGRGEPLDDAARAAMAAPLGDLYREWYDHMRGRYMMVPIELFGGLLWIAGAIFLVLAWRRRRRQNRQRLARWAIEEEAQHRRPPPTELAVVFPFAPPDSADVVGSTAAPGPTDSTAPVAAAPIIVVEPPEVPPGEPTGAPRLRLVRRPPSSELN